jgi:hypothetical protein
MSDSLIWQITKDFNSFQRKRGSTAPRRGVTTFSAEPGNLMALNSFKYSGIANSKTVSVAEVEGEHSGKKETKLVLKLKVWKNAELVCRRSCLFDGFIVVYSMNCTGGEKQEQACKERLHYSPSLQVLHGRPEVHCVPGPSLEVFFFRMSYAFDIFSFSTRP